MLMETRNHAGRTPVEQQAWERRCAEWQRHEDHRRAVVQRQAEADASARAWGEW